MIKGLFLLIILIFQLNTFAQNVVGVHHVEKTSHENEYLVKTSIKGLKQVDIAKLIIAIDSKHQFKKSTNNTYFFDRDEQEVRFYIMAVPPSGEINLEFLIVLAEQKNFSFPIKIQYSKNDEKKQLDLSQIEILNKPLLAIEDKDEESEEDKLAKNIAKFNAEQEAIKAKQEEQEKLLLDQKSKELADKLAQEELIEQKLLIAEKESELTEAKRIAEEKAKQEAQEKLLAKQKAKELAATENKITSTKQYSVQLLSLSNFSEERLTTYCKKHNLPKNEIIKREVGAAVKISFGKVNSQEAATALQQKLKRDHQIESSFIVVL